MVELTAEQIAQRAFDLNLLNERQLREIWGEFGRRNVPADQFLQLLLRREYLTNFQVERLLRGERAGYFYGEYKVLYLVGTGTFARVYRAAHRATGKLVALKVLRRRFSDDPEKTEQFFREGEMGRTLRHPNIVPVYEVASQGPSHYLVMEFVEGRNLREFIKIRRKLGAVEASRLMIDITRGLRYAFERGISHRDLKTSNVLVSSRGQAKLVDFGLAAADDMLTDEALANIPNPRTIDYAALERSTGVRKDDTRSDIYFLGCIFYHMLCGVAPLTETKDRIQRLNKSRFLEVVPVLKVEPSVPSGIAAIVNRAMEFNPKRRYQSPGEMLADLKVAFGRLGEQKDKDNGTSRVEPPLPEESVQADETVQEEEDRDRARADSVDIPESERRVLMFVESNVQMQDIFRTGLKRSGYRVLVISDPERALGRFKQDAKAADCVVFSTDELGRPALEAFNRMAENEGTEPIPAVLLLGELHRDWKKKARLSAHRVAISMPIKLKEFRALVTRLAPPRNVPSIE
jgi:eukaryotic-like serine/threonine-protein kinase